MSVQALIQACSTENPPVLALGDRGPDVKIIRELLTASDRGFGVMGLSLGDAFTQVIQRMIQEFQDQVFLTSDGVVGPITWKALCADGPVDMPEISQGDRVPAVRQAQTRLAKGGYYTAAIDGDFGPLTHAAVLRFQTDESLVADGVVGLHTWDALSHL